MKAAFCSSEMFPFIKTGGLADVSGALPQALHQCGVDIVLFLPKYKGIEIPDDRIRELDDNIFSTVLPETNIPVYLIGHEDYFGRDGLYGDHDGDYPDNLKRFHFFCRRVIEQIKALDLRVDIVHCHDWQTSLIPVFLKTAFQNDACYSGIKTLLTVHNLAFQGVFPKTQRGDIQLDRDETLDGALEFYGKINLLKAGLLYSDRVSTVSPTYAREIKTERFGCGLQDTIRSLNHEVTGILNGVDYGVWDPRGDSYLPHRYSAGEFVEGKAANKKALQRRFDLPDEDDVPLFGLVGRLSHQKGIDLMLEAFEDLDSFDVQLVIQGVGAPQYCDRLKKLEGRFSSKMGVSFEFDEPLAHLIYAASDLFLMPSNFEPCGLSQMISMKYATLPVAHRTGGLADTVRPFDENNDGNGFVFDQYNKTSFENTIRQAIDVFRDKARWHQLTANALKADFSWERSAGKYMDLYRCLRSD